MSEKGSKIAIILNVIAVLLTIALAVATMAAYSAPNVYPQNSWWVAFLGLGGQLLILANVGALAFWIARFKWWAFLPAVVLVFGMGYWGNFYQLKFNKNYKDLIAENNPITVLTYNVKAFLDDDARFDSIAKFVTKSNPDIVCFQEVGYTITSNDSAKIEQLYSQFEFKAINSDLAVFSKMPLNATKIIHFPNTTNNAMRVEVSVGNEMVVLYNLHLQTTEFNQITGGKITAIVEGEKSSEIAKITGSALKKNFQQRAMQADSIKKMIDKEKIPVIVTGDFNDTPMSYTYYSIIGDNLQDAFVEAGQGYGFTYRKLFKLFRIDYVMAQKNNFEIINYKSQDVDFSDHKPVVVKMNLIEK